MNAKFKHCKGKLTDKRFFKFMRLICFKLYRYHKSLCLQSKSKNHLHPLVQLNDTWKNMHYPPETATVMLLARMVALINQSNDKDDIRSIFSQFCHQTTNETQEIAHNLLGEKFVGQIDILRKTMQTVLNAEFVQEVS